MIPVYNHENHQLYNLFDPYQPACFFPNHYHYSILFPDKRLGIVIMTNSDNGESIFKELLEFAVRDTFTPWKWQRYFPYNDK
jgi:hypothetical protein